MQSKSENTNGSLTTRTIPAYVGKNILHLRMQHRLSLAQLSEKVGVSASYINRIEKGSRMNVSYAILNNLSTALDTNISTLFEDDDKKAMLSTSADISSVEQKRFILWAMKGTVESEQLSPSEKLDQLKIIADISRFLITPNHTHEVIQGGK